MSHVKVFLLGPPRMERDGEAVSVDTRKAIALLAYLALTGDTQRRSTLATLFWPESDQSNGRAALRRTLFVLGKAIGKAWLEADRKTVRLKWGEGLWIDVDAFRETVAGCLAQDVPAGETCDDCFPRLTEAVDLYRDDFLTGFTLRDCREFEEWQRFQTERLRRTYANVLKTLVRCTGARDDFEQAIGYAQRWLALDPLHEPAHRALMRVYALSGQRAKALRQYQACERSLEEELGVPPAGATTDLYQRILDGELEQATAPAPPPEAPARPPHNLPFQPTPFIGRERELAQIRERLADPTCRLLTVLGPGGIGKTRLAIRAARHQLGAEDVPFPDGIFFVPLAPLSEAAFLEATLADAVNFSFYGQEEPRAQLLNYLRGKQALLVLDNFEHMRKSADLLAEILVAAPGVKLLVTSRERLNLHEEWLLEVRGLSFPAGGREKVNGDFETYTAVQLFLQHARRVHAGFTPSQAEKQAVARICRLVDGIPLGIELASAWVRMLSPEQIAGEIEDNLDFLSTTLHNVPQRHRSLRAAFDHSWKLLSPAEREVFGKLAVFRGSFSRDAAAEVAGAALPLLLALADKSLLRRHAPNHDGGSLAPRYEMPDVLHPYAREKLGEDPAGAEAAHARHAAYYAAFVQARENLLKGQGQGDALAAIGTEVENVRAAWRYAVEKADLALLDQFLEGLYRFYQMRSWFQEGEEAFGRAAERLANRDGADLLCARVRSRQGRLCIRLSRFEEARGHLQWSLNVLRAQEAPGREVAPAFSNLGVLAEAQGDPAGAQRLQTESLDLFRAEDNRWGEATALLRLGNAAYAQGEFEEARTCYRQSLEIRRAIGDRRGVALCLNNLGSIADTLGSYEEATALYEESVAIKREIGDRRGVAYSLNNLGHVRYLLEAYDAARTVLEESLATFRAIGHRTGTAFVLTNLGNVAYGQGAYRQAQALYGESLSVSREVGDQLGMAYALNHLGQTGRALGAYEEAAATFREALEVAMDIRAIPVVLEILVSVAALLVAEGEWARADTLLSLILDHASGRERTRVRAKQLLATVTEEMGTDAVAAAQPAGVSPTLAEVVAEVVRSDLKP